MPVLRDAGELETPLAIQLRGKRLARNPAAASREEF